MARILASLPTTLGVDARGRVRVSKIFENRRELLEISPFLLFNVLLRRCVGGARTQTERAVVNYMANLLSLFVRTRTGLLPRGQRPRELRVLRRPGCGGRSGRRRRFLLQAHIGNYARYNGGDLPRLLEYRHRYKRRPVGMGYYADMGRAGYRDAAANRLARVYKLEDLFLRLALQFDHYRERLSVLVWEYLCH
jgi:hypothetical protein